MEIKKYTSAINAYRSVNFENEQKKSLTSVKKEKNTDKADFSSVKNSIDTIKASALKSTEGSASAEKIAALRTAISEGNYNISSEKIAAAILEG